jgi:hypothetical protein
MESPFPDHNQIPSDLEEISENIGYKVTDIQEEEKIAIDAIFNEPKICIFDSKEPIVDDLVIIKNSNKEKTMKSFPFTYGIGIKETLELKGLKVEYDNKTGKIILLKKIFASKVMEIDENGKMKRKKKRRKLKPDNIRKKIKSRFHKDLKIAINKKLIKAGSLKLFELMPQNFITNITIKLNKQALDLTLEELIKYDWSKISSSKEKTADKNKSKKNMEILEYLEQNKEISEKSEFDKIKNMKYGELLLAYFSSREFEKSLEDLYDKNKMEKIEYIEEYINKARTYVDFYLNPPKNWDVKEKTEDFSEKNNEEKFQNFKEFNSGLNSDEFDNNFNKDFINYGYNLEENYTNLMNMDEFLCKKKKYVNTFYNFT